MGYTRRHQETPISSTSARTIGLDLGDRKHTVCVLDAKRGILKEETITNIRANLAALRVPHC
jgi:hypothetical protein